MKNTALWLFAITVFAGASFMTGSSARAGTTPEPDHLKCYRVVQDNNPQNTEIVNLFNEQFGEEKDCELSTQAPLFCAPTEKFAQTSPDGDDPRGQALRSDFLCYKVKCPKTGKRDILVNDQFGQRVLTIKAARLLCTPTRKASPPPFCGQAAGAECGGSCPFPNQQCVPSASGACVCQVD
jgi:hypothetical protein